MIAAQSALFALDAYNRATAASDFEVPYGAEILLTRTVGNFAAVAYYVADSDEVIVAYRGTDDPVGDGITGWPVGSGQYDWAQSQVDQAFGFFNDVKLLVSDPTHDAHSASWSLAGHSLGGGLAGLVASINHLPAYVFDSMPFTEAAEKLFEDVSGPDASDYDYWSALAFPDGLVHSPSFALIQSAAIADELLSGLRWGGPVAGYPFALTNGQDAQLIFQNEIAAGTVTDPGNLHSQALLTIAIHGGLTHNEVRLNGGKAVYKYLFDGPLATALGFVDTEAMRQKLAYTVDDDVVALDSLFADMDVLGEIVKAGTPNAYVDVLGKLSLIHTVNIADGSTTLPLGLIRHVHGTATIALTDLLNAEDVVGEFTVFLPANSGLDLATFEFSNVAVAWSGYGGSAYLQPGGTLFFGSEFFDQIYGSDEDDVIVSVGSNGTYFDSIWGGGGNDVIFGSAGADVINAGEGNDLVYGDAGNDILTGGSGSDAMFGGTGNDTIRFGGALLEGSTDLADGGANTDTLIAGAATAFDFRTASVAALLPYVPTGTFAAPTGAAFIGSNPFGKVYAQRFEILKSEAGGNTIVADLLSQVKANGLEILDFTAGYNDTFTLNDKTNIRLFLAGTSSSSTAALGTYSIAPTMTVLGIEEWVLNGSTGNTSAGSAYSSYLSVSIAALTAASTAVRANGNLDMVDISALSIVGGGVTVSMNDESLPHAFGNVTVYGAEGFMGGAGNDTFTGNDQANVFITGHGRDVVAGMDGADYIEATSWLVLDYSASNARVIVGPRDIGGMLLSGWMMGTGGHAEGDLIQLNRNARLDIIGSQYADVLYGTSAGSWSFGHMINGDNEIRGGGGNDIINGGSGTNWLYGDDGDDTIYGGSGTDYIYGGDGYDIIGAGSGTNYVDFGTGGGELKLPDSAQAYYANMETREFRYLNGQAGTTTTVVGDFDKLTGTSFADDIHGTSGNDRIYGGGGRDTIHGGAGEDYIESMGNLYGGDHNDTIKLLGTDAGWNQAAWGEGGNDVMTTSAKQSTLYGGSGQDTLTSTTYRAKLIGGEGGDIFKDPGAYNAWNWISYEDAASGVGVDYNGSTGTGWLGDAAGDTMTGNFSFYGSEHADTFNIKLNVGYGTEIRGGAGNDVINAVIGPSTTVYGDGLTEIAGATYDDVITTTGTGGIVYGGRGDDIITGVGRLYGDAGADTIKGVQGDQTFYLGVDTDIDTFVFSRLSGYHRVNDFTAIDVVEIGSGYKYDSFSDIMDNATQVGTDVEIVFETNSKIILANYNLASLTADNFLFA